MDTSSSQEQRPERPPATTEVFKIVEQKEKFFPSGAIAFFVALVILCLVIWFGVYFLMLERI